MLTVLKEAAVIEAHEIIAVTPQEGIKINDLKKVFPSKIGLEAHQISPNHVRLVLNTLDQVPNTNLFTRRHINSSEPSEKNDAVHSTKSGEDRVKREEFEAFQSPSHGPFTIGEECMDDKTSKSTLPISHAVEKPSSPILPSASNDSQATSLKETVSACKMRERGRKVLRTTPDVSANPSSSPPKSKKLPASEVKSHTPETSKREPAASSSESTSDGKPDTLLSIVSIK